MALLAFWRGSVITLAHLRVIYFRGRKVPPRLGIGILVNKQMAGTAQKILIREAFIGLGLAVAGGAAWKVAVAAPTTRTYKAYYRNLEKYEAEHPKQPTPEQTEIEEKLYEIYKQLKAEQGGAEGTGEAKGSEDEE